MLVQVGGIVWSRCDGLKGSLPLCIQAPATPTADKFQCSKSSVAGVSGPLLLLSSETALPSYRRKVMAIIVAVCTPRR